MVKMQYSLLASVFGISFSKHNFSELPVDSHCSLAKFCCTFVVECTHSYQQMLRHGRFFVWCSCSCDMQV